MAALLVDASTEASQAAIDPRYGAVEISGTVVDRGSPVAGVRVAFETSAGYCWQGSDGGYGSVVTGADGSFSVEVRPIDIPDGAWIGIGSCTSGTFVPSGSATRYVSGVIGHGTDPAHLPAYPQQVAYATEEELAALPPVTIDLQRPGSIAGSGVTRGRTATLENLAGDELDDRIGSISGGYRFTGLVPGAYRVHVASATERFDSRPIVVTSGQSLVWNVSPSASTLSTIAGRVLVAGKAPGRVVPVTITSETDPDANTGRLRVAKDGRYTISGLVPGTYDVRVGGSNARGDRGGEVPQTSVVEIDGGTRLVHRDFRLARGSILTGTVLDVPVHAAAFHQVYSQAEAVVVDRRGRVITSTTVTGTTSTLHFRLSSVPPGSYRVYSVADTRMTATRVRASVGHPVDVGSQRPSTPTLALTVDAGRKGFEVRADALDGTQVQGGRWGRAGISRFTGLVPGTYTIVASKQWYRDRATTVRLTRSTHRTVPIGARTGSGAVSGILTIDGRPAANVRVRFDGLGGARTTAGGHFTIPAPEGTHPLTSLSAIRALGEYEAIPPYFWSPTDQTGTFTVTAARTTEVGTIDFAVTDGTSLAD